MRIQVFYSVSVDDVESRVEGIKWIASELGVVINKIIVQPVTDALKNIIVMYNDGASTLSVESNRSSFLAKDHDLPSWLTVALGEKGISEILGRNSEKRILEYHSTTSLSAQSDDVPWCSSFVNWCFSKVGINGTNSALARSWLTWGKPLDAPEIGCVVVFKDDARGSDKGHVGFYRGGYGGRIKVLGGNQDNKVKDSLFEIGGSRGVIGYRAL